MGILGWGNHPQFWCLYALQQGLSTLPQGNAEIRNEINEEAQRLGWSKVHARLLQIDPIAAQRIHPHDTQRISRALEIHQLTGEAWSTLIEHRKPYLPYPILNLGLWMDDRAALHQRIEKRFDSMLANGWISEVEKLFERTDLSDTTPALRSVGYRQIWMYLKGELTFNTMREKGIIATRQLAKRQMTWMRKFSDIQRINQNHDRDAFYHWIHSHLSPPLEIKTMRLAKHLRAHAQF